MNVSEAVASRRSIRAFRDRPVPLEVLERVFDKARMAPSGCNFQPWEATVLTGELLKALQEKLLGAEKQDPIEYSYSEPGKVPDYLARLQGMGAAMYGAMDIARDDASARQKFAEANRISFGAPVLVLIHPKRLHAAPQWSDIGMWLQTVMLLLREEGLDSCPQESMSDYARLIKDHIGVSDETHILFCGLAIGYAQPDAAINSFARERVPLSEQVRFDGF